MRFSTRIMQASIPLLPSLFMLAASAAGLWIADCCMVIGWTERIELALEALCVAAIGGLVCWLVAAELDLFADELG